MRRRGFTIAEVIVTLALMAILIGVLAQLVRLGTLTGRSAEATQVLSGALVLEQVLREDLVQIGFAADQPDPLVIGDHFLSFYRASLAPDRVVLRPVQYVGIVDRGRRFLKRREQAPGGAITERVFTQVPLEDYVFSIRGNPAAGHSVRLDLAIAVEAGKTGPGEPVGPVRYQIMLTGFGAPAAYRNPGLSLAFQVAPAPPLLPDPPEVAP